MSARQTASMATAPGAAACRARMLPLARQARVLLLPLTHRVRMLLLPPAGRGRAWAPPRARRARMLLLLPLALLAGCALVPPEPVVTGPLTAMPPPAPASQAVANGSIYQPSVYGHYPLFEDRRPRNVGDIVTVIIQEKTNATKSVDTSTNRSGNAGMGIALAPDFLPPALGPRQDFDASGSNESKGKGSSSANNLFNGNLTTTVIGVLANGNLQIAGEKQIAINRGSEYIRFSGVVDPRSITGAGSVSSTQVADARIEYRSKGVMDEVQQMGWLQRFFLNVAPF